MSSKLTLRMPCVDGGTVTTTTDVKKWHRAWRALCRPIEKVTGFKCTAFDPGLTFNDIKPLYEEILVTSRNGRVRFKKVRRKNDQGKPLSYYSRSENMSAYFASKLVKALKGKQ